MSDKKSHILIVAATLVLTSLAIAADDPRHVRHELMEDNGKAAKPLGAMLKGEREYDAGAVMASLDTLRDASMRLGELFPPGSETGEDTRAAPAIWEDRAGFEAAIATFGDAVNAAIAARPETLDAAKPVLGPIFNACKGCHDNYRTEEG
jgi:cytochrome c556